MLQNPELSEIQHEDKLGIFDSHSNNFNSNIWLNDVGFPFPGSLRQQYFAAGRGSYPHLSACIEAPFLSEKSLQMAQEAELRSKEEGVQAPKRRRVSAHELPTILDQAVANLPALLLHNPISASSAIDFAASVELGRRQVMSLVHSDRGIEAAASAVASFHAAPATSHRLPYPWPPPPDEALLVAAAHFSQVRPQPAAPDPQHRAAAAPEPPVAGGLILPLPLGYPDRPLPPLPPLDGLGLLARPWPASPLPPLFCPPPRPACRDVYPSPCYAAPYFIDNGDGVGGGCPALAARSRFV